MFRRVSLLALLALLPLTGCYVADPYWNSYGSSAPYYGSYYNQYYANGYGYNAPYSPYYYAPAYYSPLYYGGPSISLGFAAVGRDAVGAGVDTVSAAAADSTAVAATVEPGLVSAGRS